MSFLPEFPENGDVLPRKWMKPVVRRLDVLEASLKQVTSIVQADSPKIKDKSSFPGVRRLYESATSIRGVLNFQGILKVEDLLVGLAHAKQQHQQYEAQRKAQLEWLANAAHDLGASWKDIGNATGVTSQAAHQRWSERGQQRRREYLLKRRDVRPTRTLTAG